MSNKITQLEIGQRISMLRKHKGLSQKELANRVDVSRSSLAQIELGNRNLSVLELQSFAMELGFSIDQFLAKNFELEKLEGQAKNKKEKASERISVPKLNVAKFKNILLYILEKCAGKPNVGETLLYKLLYFSDFNYYELYEDHLSGAIYRKLPYGPVPQKLDTILNKMIETKALKRISTNYHGYSQKRYIPLIKPDLTQLKASEKQVLDDVIERFSDWTASAISDYSHKDVPWLASEEGKVIDYELTFYRETPYSVRTYNEDDEI